MQASGSAAIGIAGAAVKMLIVQDECLQVVLVFSERMHGSCRTALAVSLELSRSEHHQNPSVFKMPQRTNATWATSTGNHLPDRQLRLWVKSAVLAARRLLPVFPYEQTSAAPVGMSQKCQRTKPLAR
jgi:hypothetical protein